MQKRYLGLSPHNLVRVILGERLPTDSDTDNVYTRAAKHFQEWIEQSILGRKESRHSTPTSRNSPCRIRASGSCGRASLIGRGRGIRSQNRAPSRAHLSGPKKDRMEVLKHTGAHFGRSSCSTRSGGEVDALLDEVARAKPLMEVTDEYNAVHRLWRIDNL